jgi:O-antigen/teichoic acid export membrane protein/glycosyltransferase involved in cell wall biosynthesis
VKILVLPQDDNPYQELLYGELRRRGVRVRYVGRLTPSHTLNLLLLPFELAGCRLAGARLVHLHWVFAFTLPFGRRVAQQWFGVVLRVIGALGLRLVWTAHNVLPHAQVFADDVAARRTLIRSSDLVIAHAPAALDELGRLGARPRRSVIIPHGPYPASALPVPDTRGRFLFLGRIAEYKGVEDLILAFGALPAGVRASLTIAGACPDPDLEARLRELAAAAPGPVTLRLEHIPDEEMARLFADADAVVLPFRRITTSGSALLALSHGRPLVVPAAAMLAGLPDAAVAHYDGSVTDLTRVLAELATTDHTTLGTMSAAAIAHTRSTGWDQIGESTMREFSALLRSRQDRRRYPLPTLRRRIRRIRGDALYRGSLLLLANTVGLAGLGFVFWTLAARGYAPGAVGWLAGVTAGVNLLATVATLGLPNTVIRHLSRAADPRQLAKVAVTAVAVLGGALASLCLVLLTPLLPGGGPNLGGGVRPVLLVVVLVICTAAGATVDAGLVARRATGALLVKNLAGGIFKIGALLVLTRFGIAGLILAYGTGTILASTLGAVALFRRLPRAQGGQHPVRLLRRYLTFSSGNYLGTVLGILPSTVVPLEVLTISGSRQTAWFAVAFQLAGFLNFIPSTTAQVVFAEAQRGALRTQLTKAIKAIYAMLLPAVTIMLIVAPYVLQLFGTAYAGSAADCLRLLAVGALLTGGTYLVDSALIARDRTGAYIFMNAMNAALVLTTVGCLLPFGLTAGAIGWVIAQGASLAIGAVVVASSFDLHKTAPARPVQPAEIR